MGLIAILSSPATFTKNGEMDKIRTVIAGGSGIFHFEVEKHKDIAEALDWFEKTDIEALVILGGEALSSATFEYIVEKGTFADKNIPIAILPAGDNNIVAESLGAVHSEPHKALKKLLEDHKKGSLLAQITEFPLIKLEGVRGVGSLYGLFFCAGEIIRRKKIFRRKISRNGLFSRLAIRWNIFHMIRRSYRAAMGPNRLENAIRVNRNQRGTVVGHFFMLMITPLDNVFFGIKFDPSPRKDTAHFISVENTTEALIKTGRAMARGDYNKIGLPGHIMAEIQHARIVLHTPFILDGSYYETEDNGELFITVTGRQKFIRLS